MPKKTWTVDLDGTTHVVALDHGFFSGKRSIYVDNRLVDQGTKSLDMGGDYDFRIGKRRGTITMRSNLLTFNYDLFIDDKSVTTGRELQPLGPLPVWVWPFVIVCALIPILAMGGGVIPSAINGGIAGTGVAVCLLLSRVSFPLPVRIALCAATTALVWLAVQTL